VHLFVLRINFEGLVCWFTSVILALWEIEVDGPWFEANPGKKQDPISKSSCAWWFMPIIPATQEAEVRGSWSNAVQTKKT
jgi:hypothetical protein